MRMKRCPDCGNEKSPKDFYVCNKRTGALHTYCKPCTKIRALARYRSDPAIHAARHRDYVRRNPDRIRAHKVKHAFGIDAATYASMPKVCVICGERKRLCVD